MSKIAFEHFDPEIELGQLDSNGNPIKPRKKPGRKPNPPSPAQRKAQNRAAQRAFRERKRREMNEAESKIKKSIQQRDQALKQLKQLEHKIDELVYENNFLKGQLLTFKIVCLANRTDVPKFWDTGRRDKMGSDIMTFSRTKEIPQSLEFFLDQKKSIVTMNSDTADEDPMGCLSDLLLETTTTTNDLDPIWINYLLQPNTLQEITMIMKDVPPQLWMTLIPSQLETLVPSEIKSWIHHVQEESIERDPSPPSLNDSYITTFTPEIPIEEDFWSDNKHPDINRCYVEGPMLPVEAVNKMRQIREQNGNPYLHHPTELQRKIPHDPRIDLIPGPTMRDNMILFQDFYDTNELFNFLIESALFVGGELGNPDCWFVPPSFISKYWFLCPSHKPIRPDNSVDYAVFLAQRMLDRLKRRKELYVMRDSNLSLFPLPNMVNEDNEPAIEVSAEASIDILVIETINQKQIPRIISPNVFTV
ncbi:hypothetical protein A0J61_05413 [Choanephora cucurbitarum]|uniref:BZIP domain-containing protein n=1 Tax=Choanephora cucurbitarum TaxID=101091 RepID=A0A1C7NGM6_9FUNG|nr:hypothetical protein A0J61_05413 [Choanephora cucurbitarum]